MAKFALRGVNFSCSLIILSMVSASFAIFNATKTLPSQSKMPSWAENTNTWPQKLVLAMACVSLTACIIVFLAYCRGGHRRAEKVGTYYTLFAIGWVSSFLYSLSPVCRKPKTNMLETVHPQSHSMGRHCGSVPTLQEQLQQHGHVGMVLRVQHSIRGLR